MGLSRVAISKGKITSQDDVWAWDFLRFFEFLGFLVDFWDFLRFFGFFGILRIYLDFSSDFEPWDFLDFFWIIGIFGILFVGFFFRFLGFFGIFSEMF